MILERTLDARWTIAAVLMSWLWGGDAAGDALFDLPERWQGRLLPIVNSDISGAEPLMQQALIAARAEVAGLLAAPDPAPPSTPESEIESGPRAAKAALAEAYGRLGGLLLLLEVEAQADACLRNAMTLQPDEFRWHYFAGYLAMLAGNLDQAVVYLETARAIDAAYPALSVRLGKVQLERGNLAEARAALASVRDVAELASPANYYLGQIALLEHRYDDALERLSAALAANPQATEVHYPLAQAYRALGDADRAREHLSLFKLRSPEVADPLLDELQAANRRSLPAFQRALHAVRAGDYATAADEFAAGIETDPDNADARISYSRVLFLNGERDAAAAELERALVLASSNALGHFLQGVLSQAQGDLAAAEVAYRRVLELEAGHAGALFQLANLRFTAGRYAEAAADYRQALAADAAIAPARLLALVADLRNGRNEAEIAAALTALADTDAQDRQVRYGLTRLLAAANDATVRDPERALHLAVDLAVQQAIPPHQRLLALAQAASGRFDAAVETLGGLLKMPDWMLPPREREQIQSALEAYQVGALPHPAWPIDDALLSPPPFDAVRVLRDYPASKPY